MSGLTLTTRHIVFFQDDDEDYQPWATLYRVDGVVMRGATTESIVETVQMLSQWDYDEGEHAALPPLNPDEERFFVRPQLDDNDWIVYVDGWAVIDGPPEPGDYVITAHRRLGYVSLDRVVAG